jgi:hypothetical protein
MSGGQTGADQGGLLAGRELGIPTGGTAPKGWLTEEGPKEATLTSFGLVECRELGYPARTRANILNSDGTLLVGPYKNGGAALTHEIATAMGKPSFHVAFIQGATVDPARVEEFRYWLKRYQIQILNVAGNRESNSPGIQEFTRRFLLVALQ